MLVTSPPGRGGHRGDQGTVGTFLTRKITINRGLDGSHRGGERGLVTCSPSSSASPSRTVLARDVDRREAGPFGRFPPWLPGLRSLRARSREPASKGLPA